MAISTRVLVGVCSVLTVLLAAALLPASPARAQQGPSPAAAAQQHAQAFLDRMVQVSGRSIGSGATASGFGFIVGERATAKGEPGFLIVTADHLIRGAGNAPAGSLPARVLFYADPTRNVPAEVLDVHLPPQQGDLAVLVVAKPAIAPLQSAVMGSTEALVPGMAAWQLGMAGTWTTPNATGRFALREPTGWLSFDGLDGSPESAGGAVITELGLAGMVVARAADAAVVRVVPVELMAAKFKEWGLAWNIPAATPPAPAAGAAPPAGQQAAAAAPAAPQPPPASLLTPRTILTLLPSELAARSSWVPPGARVSPWSGSGAPLMGSPSNGAIRVGALPAGNLLPPDLWARGAYEIQDKIDDGAWFLLGSSGRLLGYVSGSDVVEVWPADKPGTQPDGKVVREIEVAGGKAVLRDAKTHYNLTLPLTCAVAYCDTVAIFTPVPPSPGSITPTFQIPQLSGSWHENDGIVVTVPLPRAVVETKGTRLVTCVGFQLSCQQQPIDIGG